MSFHERSYEVYVVLGSPASSPWVKGSWSKISAALDPLLKMARGRAAIRTDQFQPGSGSLNQRFIRFGRIGWNARGFDKWVHATEGTLSSGLPAEFYSCEMWAPSWTICQREHRAPDVLFAIRREATSASLKFGSICLFAVASDIASLAADQSRRSARIIATTVDAVLTGYCSRPWGYDSKLPGSFTDALNDLYVVGLFKPGPRHDRPVSLASLSGDWTSF